MKKKALKKSLVVLLSGAMLLGAAGCGEDKGKGTTGQAVTDQAATAADTTETVKDTEADASEARAEPVTEPRTEEPATEKKDLNVKDGQYIVDIDFEDGETGKFSSYTKGGKFEMENVDNELVVHIKDIGTVDYANQIYYDGFQLLQGCVYTYSFDVRSSIPRKIEYRLQINGGDFHAYAGEYIEVGPETRNISVDFTMAEDSDPAPRIVFNMGFMDNMTGDPGEHDVTFDNIRLMVKDASNAIQLEGLPDYPKVNVNQIGYQKDDTKTVFVKSKDTESFKVVDNASGAEVYTGALGDYGFHAPSDDLVRSGDFSEVKEPGTYKIVTDAGESYPFVIGDGVYDEIYTAVLHMLYLQRCGVKIYEEEAGAFGHEACHLSDAIVFGDTLKIDVTGGWHDAGDYGRYVVAGAKAVQDLLLAYEEYGIDTDSTNIPESGNGIPDILDEARYELEWMLKMQDRYTGGVYHKVTCCNFPETVKADEEIEQLVLAPISAAATGDFAAVMAKASVMYKDIDEAFAKKCYKAAVKAWKYLETLPDRPEGFHNPEGIETGEYGDNTVTDEVFWAATELYLAGYEDVKDQLMTRYDNLGLGIDLGWADITAYACYDLLKANPTGVDELLTLVRERFLGRADQLMERADEYFMMLNSDYPWGSNMTIANNGILMKMAANLTGKKEYDILAKRQMDYLLGANPLGYCFVTGFGTVSPKQPHHRPSQVANEAMPGMLVGGAANSLSDSYAKAVLYGRPAGMCYVDNVQSYSTNEVTIYWNSPLLYLLAAYK